MHEFNIKLQWQMKAEGEQLLEPQLFCLLAAVEQQGSLKQAAEQSKVSYRYAWGLLAKWESIFGQALVLLEQGRGASLTQSGKKLLEADRQLNTQFSAPLKHYSEQFQLVFDSLLIRDQTQALRLFASHDLAVTRLRDTFNQRGKTKLDLHFHGSLDALRLLQREECQIAGFHIPDAELGVQLAPQYLHYLDAKKHRLFYLRMRQQGILVAANNPKKIRTIRSLKKSTIRFINRQADSGTRLLFDHLLDQHAIKADQIRGYENVEFTHMAVAAMIASDAADAGFGIASIADQFGLDFIPQQNEHYCLAIPTKLLSDPRIVEFLQDLRETIPQLEEAALNPSHEPGTALRFSEIFPMATD